MTQHQTLVDRFQRQFSYLRLSITEKCNFKCQYCLPNGYVNQQAATFLTLNEIQNLLNVFVPLGIKKIRLTGGEPTLRRDFNAILTLLAHYPSLKEIALTTNGFRLYDQISHWQALNLSQVNVSVDSLNPALFKQITGDDRFELIMKGIEKTLQFPQVKLKINTVLMKNINDDLAQYLDFIKERNVEWRFIEFMETGALRDQFSLYHRSGQFFEQQLLEQGWTLTKNTATAGPAKVYRHLDYLGRIGLIMPYSKDFCNTCNRLRISATGNLHYCLFGGSTVNLRPFLKHKDQQRSLEIAIFKALSIKPKSHYLQENETGLIQNLSVIGG